MSSNVQTQINDLNAAVQALESSLTQITGNTMSNYNQLSRIVAQQANIYNSVYYGSGNIVTGNINVISSLITSYTKPNYDSGWFAVAASTSYPLNLGFTINLATPPTFKVLFSSTSTGIIGDGTGTANVVVDVTSQGINTGWDQSYGIRYSSNSSIILRTGDVNVVVYYNGNTQLVATSGFYRVYAY